MHYIYILRSVNSPRQCYIGVTANLKQRMEYHNTGRCPHTSKFMPWEIVYSEEFENQDDASKRERQIKNWTRAKKEALISGDLNALKKLAKRRCF